MVKGARLSFGVSRHPEFELIHGDPGISSEIFEVKVFVYWVGEGNSAEKSRNQPGEIEKSARPIIGVVCMDWRGERIQSGSASPLKK